MTEDIADQQDRWLALLCIGQRDACRVTPDRALTLAASKAGDNHCLGAGDPVPTAIHYSCQQVLTLVLPSNNPYGLAQSSNTRALSRWGNSHLGF